MGATNAEPYPRYRQAPTQGERTKATPNRGAVSLVSILELKIWRFSDRMILRNAKSVLYLKIVIQSLSHTALWLLVKLLNIILFLLYCLSMQSQKEFDWEPVSYILHSIAGNNTHFSPQNSKEHPILHPISYSSHRGQNTVVLNMKKQSSSHRK